MVIELEDVCGRSVKFTPPIVKEGGVELYVSLYVPSTITVSTTDPAKIIRKKMSDKGDIRRSTYSTLKKYFAITAPATEQEKQLVALVTALQASKELVIA
jgi:hypothetical protein